MKLAYLILAHKNPDQLKRLVRVLNIPGCFFYIHIDKKSDLNKFKREIQTLDIPNIKLVQYRNIRWGSISQTEARIKLMKMSLDADAEYTNFVVLSGQTYPIKPMDCFLHFLREHSDTTFMEHYPIPYDGLINKGLDRIECYAYTIFGKRVTYLPKHYHKTFNLKGKILNVILSVFHVIRKKRRFPDYVKAYYGIDWWVLTRQAASYIIDFIHDHPDYHKYHRYTKNTSEIYFPSILAGTNYPGKVVNESLNFMEWLQDGSGHPKILTLDDLQDLKKSKKFFARKFDSGTEFAILDRIDDEILKMGVEERSLVCITTCNRLKEVKKFIFSYIDFCNRNRDFDFLLALDGNNPEYIEFCNTYQIPLLYSEEREGVGISKNRVLEKFPDYDYYFFVEDDIELLSGDIFINHIKASKTSGFSHYVMTKPRKIIRKELLCGKLHTFALFGSAHFTFFEGNSLRKIGGWHTMFAKYRRFGHTEHTYRFYNNDLQPAPFVVLENENQHIIVFYPPAVSNVQTHFNTNQIIDEEQVLIEEKIEYFPFKTISAVHINSFSLSYNSKVYTFLKNNSKHYPLTDGKERRLTLAEYYFERSVREVNFFKKVKFIILSVMHNPFNVPLKHFIKTKLFVQ